MVEACKRLIKNCIICWNYLYLSQKLDEIKDTTSREAFLDAVAYGSAVAWQHLNLLGEYDFSDEKLRDSIGIRPPQNWWTKWGAILGVAQSPKIRLSKGISEMAMSHLVPLLEFNRVGKCSHHRRSDDVDICVVAIFGCHLKDKGNKISRHLLPRKRAPLCAVA
jgi:hypothetical protein